MIVKLGKHEILIDEIDAYLVSSAAGYSFQVQDRSTANFMRYYVKARRNRNGKEKPYLHRLIMKAPPHFHVDHINGDGRDNRRCNLRMATRSTNMANQRRVVGASGYRGVVQSNGDCNAWTARVQVCGEIIYSYSHPTPEAAARARDALALQYFGKRAVLNFPPDGHEQAESAFKSNRLDVAA